MSTVGIDPDILRRMLSLDGRSLPPEVARFFLNLSLSDADRMRIASLSERANDGDLTADEHDQLAMYVLLTDFLAIVQSSARQSLAKQPPAA